MAFIIQTTVTWDKPVMALSTATTTAIIEFMVSMPTALLARARVVTFEAMATLIAILTARIMFTTANTINLVNKVPTDTVSNIRIEPINLTKLYYET